MTLRAYITGAGGFTGQYLIEALEQAGIEPHASSCDLENKQALIESVRHVQPDWVIHLAAKSFVADEDAIGFYRVNVLGTENLLQALAALPVPPSRILIASSANVYGTPPIAQINESVIPEPVNHYAYSKLAMEHMVRTWFKKLPIVITRPFNYTGFGQNECFVVPKIVQHFAKRAPSIELGNLNVSRDFSDVRDLVSSYIALLKSTVTGVTVNVCRGEATSLKEMIQIMNALAGYEIKITLNPAFLRSNDIPILHGDHRLLKSLVNQVPQTPIRQTLAWMYERYLAES